MFVLGLEALPRQLAALHEVDEHVRETLEVVTAALLDAEMVIDGGVTGSAGEALVVAEGNMFVRAGQPVPFGEAEIDDVHHFGLGVLADDEVVGLDVSVDEAALVEVLEAREHLQRDAEHREQREFAVAVIEEVLETGAEQLHDHHVVVARRAEPVDHGHALGRREGRVRLRRWRLSEVTEDFGFIDELGVLRPHLLQLDRHIHFRLDVLARPDLPERPLSDFLHQLVLLVELLLHRR